MRIGFFTSVDGWGGSEMYLKSLMEKMEGLGHQAVLFGIEGTRLFKEAVKAGIPCVAWRRSRWMPPLQKNPPLSRFRKRVLRASPPEVANLLRDCSKVAEFWRLFGNEPVDVMHVNINEYYELAGIACKLRRIPCLGMFCAFPGKNAGGLSCLLTRWTPRLYTAMAGKSQACINAWEAYCGLVIPKERFIWNGVDLKKFSYQERKPMPPGRTFRLLAVGRFHPMKGWDVLIRAMAVLDCKKVTLSIAGHGEEEHVEEMERLVGALGVSSKVQLLGYVEDVATLYRRADCTVSTSVFGESFGQTLIEAMACGSPLITSDFGPFPEINVHEVTGLVVPAGSVSSLVRAILRMMENEDLRIQMGRLGRERAERFFSAERMIAETVALYSTVAKRPGSAAMEWGLNA
jgi:glycosyltransferase involved in cell wall biosynthesis